MAGSDVLVVCEQRDGAFKTANRSVLRASAAIAGKTGGTCVAVGLGKGLAESAKSLDGFGAPRGILLEDDRLPLYNADAYLEALLPVVKEIDPRAVLFPCSALGRDLSARLAAALDTGLANDCTGIDWDGGLVAVRPVYAGRAVLTVRVGGPTPVASLRANVFPAGEAEGSTDWETRAPELDDGKIRLKTVEIRRADRAKQDLTESEIVVSGGRGMKGPEHFALIEKLAKALGGVTGASRAVVDAGWRPHAEQVGQTGKVISPSLYVACGISGAVQHLAGMQTSKTIVAINTDKDAPIFKVATYGVVGDAFEVIPAMVEELEKRNGSG